MACSSILFLGESFVSDLEAIGVDLSGSAPDFSNGIRPSDEVIDRWAETAAFSRAGSAFGRDLGN